MSCVRGQIVGLISLFCLLHAKKCTCHCRLASVNHRAAGRAKPAVSQHLSEVHRILTVMALHLLIRLAATRNAPLSGRQWMSRSSSPRWRSALPLFPGLTRSPPTLSTAVAQKPLPTSGHPAAHFGAKNFEAFLASAVQHVDAATPAASRPPAELARLPSIVGNTKSNADATSVAPLSAGVTAFSPTLLTTAILNEFQVLPAPATTGLATPAALEDQRGPAVRSSQGSEVKSTKAEEVVPPEPPPTNLPLLPRRNSGEFRYT